MVDISVTIQILQQTIFFLPRKIQHQAGTIVLRYYDIFFPPPQFCDAKRQKMGYITIKKLKGIHCLLNSQFPNKYMKRQAYGVKFKTSVILISVLELAVMYINYVDRVNDTVCLKRGCVVKHPKIIFLACLVPHE